MSSTELDKIITDYKRHVMETQRLFDQLTTDIVLKEPIETGRALGEIFLHLIRSLEFYSRGLAIDKWEALPYNLKTYSSSKKIIDLFREVNKRVEEYLNQIDAKNLDKQYKQFNKLATTREILVEMLEHSIQHRGQILVYYRLLGIEPAKIPYII